MHRSPRRWHIPRWLHRPLLLCPAVSQWLVVPTINHDITWSKQTLRQWHVQVLQSRGSHYWEILWVRNQFYRSVSPVYLELYSLGLRSTWDCRRQVVLWSSCTRCHRGISIGWPLKCADFCGLWLCILVVRPTHQSMLAINQITPILLVTEADCLICLRN